MDRRQFLFLGPALYGQPLQPATGLLQGGALQPIPEPHFPSRLYLYVWRNWELANSDRIARVIRTTPGNVEALGYSMGLPKKRLLTPDQLQRIYITVIRQNWQVLPESQIVELLGWDRKRFAFTLKEDDFLAIKLGPKPECPEIIYHLPSAQEKEHAARISQIVQSTVGPAIQEPGEDLFHFVRELSDPRYIPLRDSSAVPVAEEIDLTSGWSLVLPRNELLSGAARRFQSYLETSMNARVPLAPTATAKSIRIELEPSGNNLPDGFEVRVTDSEVRITGRSEAAALQGIYSIEDQIERRGAPFLAKGSGKRNTLWNPRYLYSYFALYGDPLMQPEIDPFPDAYLEKLARDGTNGVWIQAVLNTLAPSRHFPEFGAGSEIRLNNLNRLVERARRYGVKVYLYLNEPRAMPAAFFQKHPGVRGRSEKGFYAMCTSVPVVREWIAGSLTHVMKNVPNLGGFFTITMSENLTNCFSHGSAWGKGAPNAGDCPRCARRQSWEVIGELIRTFRDGIRRASSRAELIDWDWGWGDLLATNLIPLLPRDSKFLSISEWDQPVHRGGVSTRVHEYSISVVGPGPRAQRNWAQARKHGIATLAKVQFNNTWEISAVPYIPVMHLILQHCENLSRAGISGVMASWTCGGYASPNLAGTKPYDFEPHGGKEDVLQSIAERRYGKAAAPKMIEAWRLFSEAFQQFPYGVAIYTIPTQHGPANLLRFRPTGYHASMMLFPQDDWQTWAGAYPPSVVYEQFTKMADGWQHGLIAFRSGFTRVPQAKRAWAKTDLAIAETCYNHFRSVADQVQFYLLRGELQGADASGRTQILAKMKVIAEREIQLAKRQFRTARSNSTIAYEASNHYYYTPLDLVEKILNCRHIIDEEIPRYQL